MDPMTDDPGLALDDLADGLAEELGDVSAAADGDVTSFERAGTTFARISSSVVEVHLPDDIAAAAIRSADTAAIPNEQGWVRFAPSADGPHVVDRAEAWFRTAWRHATDT
jgi:hypothetical protein